MTQISFTSGEILDIMDSLALKADKADDADDYHLACYYYNMIQQFELIYDKLQDFTPENRVANLILAAN